MSESALLRIKEVIEPSLLRAIEKNPTLTHNFYEKLFAQYPAAKPMFSEDRRAAQEKMLSDTLGYAVTNLTDPSLASTLTGLGRKHAGYGVQREHFDWVGACLLETLGETDPEWNAGTKSAWAEVYGIMAGIMWSGIESARNEAA